MDLTKEITVEQAMGMVGTNWAKEFIRMYWEGLMDASKRRMGMSVEGRNIYLGDSELPRFIEEISPATQAIGIECSLSHHRERKIIYFKPR